MCRDLVAIHGGPPQSEEEKLWTVLLFATHLVPFPVSQLPPGKLRQLKDARGWFPHCSPPVAAMSNCEFSEVAIVTGMRASASVEFRYLFSADVAIPLHWLLPASKDERSSTPVRRHTACTSTGTVQSASDTFSASFPRCEAWQTATLFAANCPCPSFCVA